MFTLWAFAEKVAGQNVLFINSHEVNFFLRTLKKYAPYLLNAYPVHITFTLLRAGGIKVNKLLL
jgi:hypothetical protein